MMTPSKIERAINHIAWGKSFVKIKESNERELVLIIGSLSLHHRAWVNFQYDNAFDEAMKAGIMTEAQTLKDLSERGVWTHADDERIKYLSSELEKLNDDEGLELTRREKLKVKKIKTSIKKHIGETKNRRNKLLSNSAERVAEEARMFAFIFCSIQNVDGTQYWSSWEDFCNETNQGLIREISHNVANVEQYDVKTLRAIARSPSWRYRWAGAKNIGDLFGKPVCELNDNQASLIYWSQVYDSVYDAYERPTDEIIQDDDALDAWFEEQGEKAKKQREERGREKRSGSMVSGRVARHGEVFVTASVNDGTPLHSPDKIYELNGPLQRKFIGVQEKRVKKHKVVGERDLRDNQDARRVINSNDAIVSKKRGRSGYATRNIDKLLPGGTLTGRRRYEG